MPRLFMDSIPTETRCNLNVVNTPSCVKLTALLHGVASLQIVTGPCRVLPAAIGALHAVELAAERLQGGLNVGVDGHDDVGGVAVGQSLVFAELWRRRRPRVVVVQAAEQVIHGCHWRSWRSWRSRGAVFSWGTLSIS